jgi:hypothetical protein
MKAVMLSINEMIDFIDITHDVKPQDILGGAWILKNSAYLFPPETIHLAVIDPGVGTDRRPILVRHRNHYFIGPDNGLFSLVTDNDEVEVIELTQKRFWRINTPSSTFHGRDIFAPVAAHLAKGIPYEELGSSLSTMEIYRWAIPTNDKEAIQGWVLHIDRFGNLITNIPEKLVQSLGSLDSLRIYVGNHVLKGLTTTYGSVEPGEGLALIGSAGTLEISINKGNAAAMLGVIQGSPVSVLKDRSLKTQ